MLFILGFYGDTETNSKNTVVKILGLVAITGMYIFFNFGVHAILGVLPEMVPTQYKMRILQIWGLAVNLTMMFHNLIFPIVFKKIGHYAFAIFLGFNVIYLIWIQFRYVESKDIPSIDVFRKFDKRGYF